ncbi:putative ribonuclease H-like domain-containing protein [Tanacetum coccineum]
MQDELLQFKLQMVWTLVELPYGKRAIGTKWVYKNKKDDKVARIEAIRLFLAYASFMNFIVYQMDVKSAFLYGIIEEEVYVCQPPRFEDLKFPNKVYKVEKALYGLHQALRAWYETLSTYLLENGFRRGTIDKTLFIKKDKDDILFVQKDDGIFISQDKYVADILKKFNFATVRTTSTPMETNKALLKDEEAADVDVHLYRSMIGSLIYLTASRPDIMFAVCACASDYAGASLDRKSTTGGCQFLGRRLISWQCKKQTIVANSTTEAEYVASANCCGQVLWIQNQLLDYGYNFMNTKIFIDNESTICIVKNPVFHSKTKHIEIRHYFIRNSYEKRLIQVIKIHTDHNVADLLIKAFNAATTASSLVAEQDSGNIIRTQSMATLYESFPHGTDSSSGPRCQDTILGGAEAQIRFEVASKQSNDPPLLRVNILGSADDNMKLKELMEFCTKLSIRALDVVNAGVSKLMLLSLNLLLPVLVYAARHSLTAFRHKLMLPGITYYCWAKTVNGERQIQALVHKKKVIITEKSVRCDILLDDAEGTECLPNDVIFKQLTLIGAKTIAWNEFSSTMASSIILFLDKQVEGMSKHKGIYVTPSHMKKIFANMKREGKGFSGRITPLFQTMMVQALEDMEPIPDVATNKEPTSTPSCDPPQSGEDILQFTELMTLCTKLQKQVLDLEEAKTAQEKEIASLKNREDASKQGRKIADLDADAEVTLIDETQERFDEEMLFDVQDDLQGKEVVAKKEVAKKEVNAADPVTTAGEVVTSASATTTIDELTLAQTLIEIKAAKLKAITTTATTITTDVASTRSKAKGIVFHDQEEQASTFTPIVSSSQLPQVKDKGKGKKVETEKPLKKKDQIALDEELALRLQAEEQAKLEKERVAHQEASKEAIIE